MAAQEPWQEAAQETLKAWWANPEHDNYGKSGDFYHGWKEAIKWSTRQAQEHEKAAIQQAKSITVENILDIIGGHFGQDGEFLDETGESLVAEVRAYSPDSDTIVKAMIKAAVGQVAAETVEKS
jgi:hypothetical protein